MRIREYMVGMQQFHILFANCGITHCQFVDRLYYPDIPADAKLHHVCLSNGGMQWSVYIEHPSFDDIPEFQFPPSQPMTMKSYPIITAADKDWVLDGLTRDQLITIRDALDKRIEETPLVEPSPSHTTWSNHIVIHEDH
jgi:hypothetical protein